MRNYIISDFDETITERDTIEILGQLPFEKDPEKEPKWSYFTENYMDGWNKYHNQAPPRGIPLLKNVEGKEISEDNFRTMFGREFKYQEFLKKIELNSTNELCAQKHFKGTMDLIPGYVQKCLQKDRLELRNGFKTLLEHAFAQNDSFYIFSVNWSTEFIYNIINTRQLLKENILCNALNVIKDNYDGTFSNRIITGSDKVEEVSNTTKFERHRTDDDDEVKGWYIGDSETDLLSILHPNVNGILLIDPKENEAKFNKIVQTILGLSEPILNNFLADNVTFIDTGVIKTNGNSIYLAKSWDAITKLIYNEK